MLLSLFGIDFGLLFKISNGLGERLDFGLEIILVATRGSDVIFVASLPSIKFLFDLSFVNFKGFDFLNLRRFDLLQPAGFGCSFINGGG